MNEEKYIKKLRELIKRFGNDDEAFHCEYDDLVREILEKELNFKKFLETVDNEYKGSFWTA